MIEKEAFFWYNIKNLLNAPLQYKIPQNVGIEDRIVGPLTLRQLIILGVGCGSSYIIFTILTKYYELNVLEYIVIAIPALISAAAALIRINDISFTRYVLYFLEFSLKPKYRRWDHRGIRDIVAPDLNDLKNEPKTPAASDAAKKPVDLATLTRVLDSGGFEHVQEVAHNDMDKAKDDDLVGAAFFGHKNSETENMYWRTTQSHKERLKLLAKLPAVKPAATLAPAKAPAPASAPAVAAAPVAPGGTKPRKRKRNRGAKAPQPARLDTQVNTTRKNQPAEFVPASVKGPDAKPVLKEPGKTAASQDGEIQIKELEKGEIEINLD